MSMTTESVTCYIAEGASPEALQAVLGADRWEWFYGERADDTVLLRWTPVATFDATPYRHARLFGPTQGELTWWRNASHQFTCRWLSAEAPPAPLPWTVIGSFHSRPDDSLTLLYGEWDENSFDPPTWSEARIPRFFIYPVGSKVSPNVTTRVVLTIRRYDNPTGQSLTRLVAMDTLEIQLSEGA